MAAVLLALGLLAAPVAAAPASAIAAADTADTAASAAPAWRFVAAETLGVSGDGVRLAGPAGLATDAFGRVYVSDGWEHRLLRFAPDGRLLDQAGSLGSEANQLRGPGAVARLGSLGVAVLDGENRRVVGWDLEMRSLGVLADLASAELDVAIGPVLPVALAADRGGAFYVGDADRDRVLAFDFTGRFLRELGGHGREAGRFAGLAAVAVGPRGVLVACDRPDPDAGVRVQWFDAGGQALGPMLAVLGAGTGTARRGRPGRVAVAVDDSARVAVADEASGVLECFAAARTPLARLGGLARPVALAFAPDGTLLVAEAGAARVRRFRLVPAAPGE